MFAFDESIVSVRRPGRYIGKEWNAVVKPPSPSTIRVALCYPDVYEIGMSYIGLRILYEVLNRIPDVACERVFAPWPDMEAFLRARAQSLFTLETRTPLGECDLVCFSLNYEMSYSNILTDRKSVV